MWPTRTPDEVQLRAIQSSHAMGHVMGPWCSSARRRKSTCGKCGAVVNMALGAAGRWISGGPAERYHCAGVRAPAVRKRGDREIDWRLGHDYPPDVIEAKYQAALKAIRARREVSG